MQFLTVELTIANSLICFQTKEYLEFFLSVQFRRNLSKNGAAEIYWNLLHVYQRLTSVYYLCRFTDQITILFQIR